MTPTLVLTCEHAVDHVPQGLPANLLPASRRGTHWAFDLGALAVGRALARLLHAPLVAGKISRLLIDLNRSPHHPKVLSPFARKLPVQAQQRLLQRYHHAHWEAVARAFESAARGGRPIFHVAVHSFTPLWIGDDGTRVRRTADVGLLYDSARPGERAWATRWLTALAEVAPTLRVRRNYPYLGRADGLATATRKRWGDDRYLGFELELNQSLLARPLVVARTVATSLRALLDGR